MKKTPSKNWNGVKGRPSKKMRRTVHVPSRVLGSALLAAFVEGGQRLTPGMRRTLGLDAAH
ncbi:MAG: hypothetical protein EPN36_03285 [Rhodanobacteraceae bacterium]|nr:MAG: hypothetical protein EPN36_03285 [Rhodanobacteraceae bacterium]